MKTVLIVEDEKMIRQGIRTMIQRSGVPVEVIMECGNGEIAWEILKSQKIDVMFTDIRMPKMNGVELVQKVQELADKPIIVVVSGYADFSYAVEMMRHGVREYILKPVEREKIQQILQKLDKEIAQGQESSRTSKRIGQQQLKYLMLNEQITEEEMDTLQSEYENDFGLQNYYVCVLNPKDTVRDGEEYIYLNNVEENDIYLVPEENMDKFKRTGLADEYAGISRRHSGIRELKTAYEEALAARKRAFCTNRGGGVYIEEQEKHVPSGLLTETEKLIETESRIQRVQLLGTDKTEEIIKGWNAFFRAVEKERMKTDDFQSCMDDFFEEVKKTYRNILTEDMDIIKRLCHYYRFEKLKDYEKEFMDWTLSLHERINSRFDTNKNTQKIKQAIEYIKENYDKDLNMAVVSNYISMNYSLFSYSFKEYTGSNFVNYLKGIRMEEAKRLLAMTDMRIIEISQKVGYDNEKHFMKIFKSSVGVSPSEYRKNTRLQ